MPYANKLFRLYDKANNTSKSVYRRKKAVKSLKTCTKQSNQDVAAHNRNIKRHGFAHRPKTTEEIGLVQIEILERVVRALEGMLDVARYKVSAPLR